MDAIKIENLSKTFLDETGSRIKALDDVSLTVKDGEMLGLLGANGAGKTTLISILCGLLSKDKGSITILGKDLEKDLDDIKPRINIVTGFTMVDLNLTIKEYLKYYSILYGIKDKEKKVEELMKKLDIKKKENLTVRSLSAGYKQRVLLAKALVNNPEIIYMDEPTVGLDVSIAIKVRNMIRDLKKKGTTMIFTSHNLAEVEQLCDRIALISNGKIIETGTIENIKERIRNNKLVEIVCKRTEDFVDMISKEKYVKSVKNICGKIIIETKTINDVDKLMKKAIDSDHIIISIRKIEPSLEEAFLNIIEREQ